MLDDDEMWCVKTTCSWHGFRSETKMQTGECPRCGGLAVTKGEKDILDIKDALGDAKLLAEAVANPQANPPLPPIALAKAFLKKMEKIRI